MAWREIMNTMDAKVYVVDDDASVREAVGSLIRSAGLRVQAFSSARDVWTRAHTDPPHCIVLDVDMPGLSGLELQRELVKAHLAIPIVFLTGKGDIPMSVRAIKAGAVEFLTKPYVDEDLLDAIRQALDQPRHQGEQASDDSLGWISDGSTMEPDRPSRVFPRRKIGRMSRCERSSGTPPRSTPSCPAWPRSAPPIPRC